MLRARRGVAVGIDDGQERTRGESRPAYQPKSYISSVPVPGRRAPSGFPQRLSGQPRGATPPE